VWLRRWLGGTWGVPLTEFCVSLALVRHVVGQPETCRRRVGGPVVDVERGTVLAIAVLYDPEARSAEVSEESG